MPPRQNSFPLLILPVFGLFIGCSQGGNWARFGNVEDALASLDPDVKEVIVEDTDGDGIGDAIDLDGDGEIDIQTDGESSSPPDLFEEEMEEPSGGDSPGGDSGGEDDGSGSNSGGGNTGGSNGGGGNGGGGGGGGGGYTPSCEVLGNAKVMFINGAANPAPPSEIVITPADLEDRTRRNNPRLYNSLHVVVAAHDRTVRVELPGTSIRRLGVTFLPDTTLPYPKKEQGANTHSRVEVSNVAAGAPFKCNDSCFWPEFCVDVRTSSRVVFEETNSAKLVGIINWRLNEGLRDHDVLFTPSRQLSVLTARRTLGSCLSLRPATTFLVRVQETGDQFGSYDTSGRFYDGPYPDPAMLQILEDGSTCPLRPWE